MHRSDQQPVRQPKREKSEDIMLLLAMLIAFAVAIGALPSLELELRVDETTPASTTALIVAFHLA